MRALYQLSVDLLGSLCRLRTGRVEEQCPVDRALARYRTESQEIRKERHGITVWIQLVAVTNLRVAVPIGSVGKLERYESVVTRAKPLRAFSEHLICKRRPDERRQKLVKNDPLIVPPQLPGGFVEDVIVALLRQPRFIDKRVVSFEHGEMQLRDQHVRVVARVADNRDALCVSLEVSSVHTKQELRRVVTLVEERMAGRSVAVQRFEVELRTASIV